MQDELWQSFTSRGGESSRELVLKIYEILKSVESKNGRVSRQEIRNKLIVECNFEENKLDNLDRIMRKLEREQLIRKEKETDTNLPTPNKDRTYYRLNSELVHRGKITDGTILRIPVYKKDPPNPKNGEIWLIDDTEHL